MIRSIKNFCRKLKESAEENRRREAEKQQMLRENLVAWNKLNKDFIEGMNREVNQEIDRRYDVSEVSQPDACNFSGSHLKH